MSTLGEQEALSASADGAWELVGRDMIRTKRNADGSGGMIVAQFWTSPSEEHARLMASAPELLAALKAVDPFGDLGPAKAMKAGLTNVERASFDGIIERVRAAIAKAEGRS